MLICGEDDGEEWMEMRDFERILRDFEGCFLMGGLSVLEGGFPESVQNGQTYPF